MASSNYCVVVMDEHALNREALGLLLSRAMPDAKVFDSPPDFDTLPICEDANNLVLYHLRPPFLQSLNALQKLRTRYPEVSVVALTDTHDDNVSQLVRIRGASGLFHTLGSSDELLATLRYLFRGRDGFNDLNAPAQPMDSRFTPRQLEVLDQLCQGKSNKEIGIILNMSEHTVRTHLSAIFAILGTRNRTEAVMAGRHLLPGYSL